MTDKLRELFRLLEERLVQHDDNRKEVQSRLSEACSEIKKGADLLEERITEEVRKDFGKKEERILGLIEKLNSQEEDGLAEFTVEVDEKVLREWRYEVEKIGSAHSFVDSYKLKIFTAPNGFEDKPYEIERIVSELRDHLNKSYESMTAAQDMVMEICNQRRKEADKSYEEVNRKLELLYNQNDEKFQSLVNTVRENIGAADTSDELKELITKVRLALIEKQTLSLSNYFRGCPFDTFEIVITEEISLECLDIKRRKPTDVAALFTKDGELSVSFTFFSPEEIKFLLPFNFSVDVTVKMWEKGQNENNPAMIFTQPYKIGGKMSFFFSGVFSAGTTYHLSVKVEYSDLASEWSDKNEVKTPRFEEFCVWKKSFGFLVGEKKRSFKMSNSRIARKNNYHTFYSTLIGNSFLPPNCLASWTIKSNKYISRYEKTLFVGVAPFDIDQSDGENNISNCGWYINCFEMDLHSGPPHNYSGKRYGMASPPKSPACTADGICVLMDTVKSELSFVVDGINFGVAYEGIPLDKPLVPCVLLKAINFFVKLDAPCIKETKNNYSIPVPQRIIVKNCTLNSITIAWKSTGSKSLYQVEVDGGQILETTKTNTFAKTGLLSGTEHTFRIRGVKGIEVGKWSCVVKGRTMKVPDFSDCVWVGCAESIDKKRKYDVDKKNPIIATKVGEYDWCTVIGSAIIPLNQVTQWKIKVLKSMWNDGDFIFVGIAPIDINQNERTNFEKCGWYLNCFDSTLHSGLPHCLRKNEYGPRKEDGAYIHTGDSVGVMMDTTNGELSFVLDGVNPGVVYEGIPLDKPLVPCVVIKYKGDSVELVI